jgi:hypothetical protein
VTLLERYACLATSILVGFAGALIAGALKLASVPASESAAPRVAHYLVLGFVAGFAAGLIGCISMAGSRAAPATQTDEAPRAIDSAG